MKVFSLNSIKKIVLLKFESIKFIFITKSFHMRFTIILLLGLVMFFSSCQKEEDDNNGQDMPVTMLNVSYGSNAQQKIDVYLPAGRSTSITKVIIMIHGGGWNTGDKTDLNQYVDSLKKREPTYAIFNINYRLANPPDLFQAQENDVRAAVEFIYNKRTEYRISDKFVLVGASAGGHLALLQGYKHTAPIKVKAIIDFFGPTDLIEMYNNPPNPLVPALLASVTGGSPTTQSLLYQISSPLNYVTGQSPPTLILHGGIDIVVSPTQSILLKNKLQTNSVVHQYIFYPTEGHGWVGANLTDSFNKIQAFLASNVN
jgi:acetyl esterase/lipase